MAEASTQRPEFRNIHLFQDVSGYRLPWAGRASILHRITGLAMFVLLPLALWLFDGSLRSPQTYNALIDCFNGSAGWLLKLLAFVLSTAFFFHLFIGIRHIVADVTHNVSKEQGRTTALTALGLGALLSLAVGGKIFGLY